MKKSLSYFYGCLVGGTLGDALGAPIEFMSYDKIKACYGEEGLVTLICPPGLGYALITDDTQMTLFTAEGILRSVTRAKRKNMERNRSETTTAIFRAYLRWLYTQGLKTPHWEVEDYDGWVVKIKKLHAYREPSVTCLTSLGKGLMGTMQKPVNDSKGSGGIMRVAPIGLVETQENVFDLGCQVAAITHGHPLAYLPAGALALLIHTIIQGAELKEAVAITLKRLKESKDSEECASLLERAIKLVEEGEPSYKKVESLGKGFMGHEALAIAVYAALSYPRDFNKAIILAANHGGDSDSTASITGSILGSYLGIEGIEEKLIQHVELREEIKQLAEDLFTFYEENEEWLQKYPAW